MEGINAPLPAVPTPNQQVFDISTFNGRQRFQEIHELLSEFIHYQSHIQSHLATTLPLEIPHPNKEQWQLILNLLKEENCDVQTLRDLLEIIRKNNVRMIKKYDRRAAPWEQEQQAFGDNANNGWGQQ